MSEKLQCTRRIRNEQCTASASEVEIKGMLTVAKAILCAKHAAMADKDSFISERGWPLGKVADAQQPVKQERIQPATLFQDERK